jgi:GNAT superfamily N-acetyltransferase
VLHVVEITDLDQDEMLAWAFAIETSDGLEVEEIFVRPTYRGAGNGRDLARTISEISATRKMPIKCWIPHIDWTGAPTHAQSAIFRQLGVTAHPVPERWAAAVAAFPAHTP